MFRNLARMATALESIATELTGIRASLHRIADEMDNVNQHSTARDVIDQLRIISQAHR